MAINFQGIFDILAGLVVVPILLGLAILGAILFKRWYRVASANEALVISGGRQAKPQVIIAGGKFVSPFRKCVTFPLNVMTIRSDEQETQSSSMVPIMVQWTAQLRADTTNEETLEQAVIGFLGASENDIRDSLKQTLDGEVRAVLGLMTPEDVVRNKADLSTKVSDNVNDRMKELGFILISLNIAEVTDRNNHYHNLGASEREGRRREAENITAVAEQSIAETKASTEKAARYAELEKEEEVAARQRDVDLKRAGFKAEVDQAQTDASFAGQVREQERLTDLATRQGAVAVERERQSQAAATARREVVTTEAETARQKLRIEAEAAKDKAEIDAAAQAEQGKIAADADAAIVWRRASGDAEAAREKARGDSDAIKTRAEAEAEQIRKTGQANADAEEALGRARAAATLAEGQAKAEAERLMAEALAANDAVNLQVTLAEIESRTRIEVSTAIATAVAEVGTNTTIIDMGTGPMTGDGDLLNRFLGSLPETLKRLDVKNEALNGKALAATVNGLASALLNQPAAFDVEPAEAEEATEPTEAEEATSVDEPGPTSPSEGTAAVWVTATDLDEAPVEASSLADESGDVTSAEPTLLSPSEPDEAQAATPEPAAAGPSSNLIEWIEDVPAAAMPAADILVMDGLESTMADLAAQAPSAQPAPPQAADVISLDTGKGLVTADQAQAIIAELVESERLSYEDSVDMTRIINIIRQQESFDSEDIFDLASLAIGSIRQMRASGQKVDAMGIARQMLDHDGDGVVSARELIDEVRRVRNARRASR